MKYLNLILLICAMLVSQASAQEAVKRTIVTTDGEIDDVDTFIRYLMYTNEFETEGLIYSSSMWHWKGDGKGTKFTSEMEMTRNIYGEDLTDLRWPGTTWMEELLAEYKKVHPNLLLHDKNYPSAEELLALVKTGNIDFEGEMDTRTEGSEWIAQKLLDDDPREIFLQAWGGTNTIARALKSIEEDHSKTENLQSFQYQSYLKSENISTKEKQLLFQLRTRSTPTRANYKNKYKFDLTCPLCKDKTSEQTDAHLLDCPAIANMISDKTKLDKVKHDMIFNGLQDQSEIVKMYSEIFKLI